MKTPFRHLIPLAAVLCGSIATAQEPPNPAPPAGPPPREAQPPRDRPPRGEDFDQPEGRGFPGGRGDRQPGDRSKNGASPLPAKPQPYLGVATAPLDPALSSQLGFTPGLGLIVEEVIPDGPAAKAGLQTHDVIKQLNDQLISNPAHLSALARHFGKDAEVTLLVLRKGQEQKFTVKIGERMMREPSPMRTDLFNGMPGMSRQPFERRGENPRRNGDEQNRPPGGGGDRQPPKPSADLLREVGPGGAPQVQTFQDRVSTTWSTANAKVMLKDATGEIEVRSDNGKRTLTAKTPDGKVAFDGPIDTEEQRKAIPAEFRKMLDQVDVRSHGERRPDGGRGEGRGGAGEPEGAKPRRGPGEVQ